jgi:hypothetical protein
MCMSEEPTSPAAPDEKPRCPECDTPVDLRHRLRDIAARLRVATEDLGGEVMLDIPSRLGDREGLLVALVNELDRLVG